MREPADRRLRQTAVLRSFAVLMLLVLVGCGSPQAPTSSRQAAAASPSETASVGGCPVGSQALRDARTLALVDLDGDGTKDEVRLTSSGSPCPDQLLARLGDRVTGVPAQAGSEVTAYGVDLPGHEGALLAVRSDHPRGGFQLRIYAARGDALVELEVDGRALVRFVALDVLEHPLSVDCRDGEVAVTEAVSTSPRGGAHAWDVKRTSYAVVGARLTQGATSIVADDVAPDRLEAEYPELVRHSMFESCRSAD